jgi:hypothetical protein
MRLVSGRQDACIGETQLRVLTRRETSIGVSDNPRPGQANRFLRSNWEHHPTGDAVVLPPCIGSSPPITAAAPVAIASPNACLRQPRAPATRALRQRDPSRWVVRLPRHTSELSETRPSFREAAVGGADSPACGAKEGARDVAVWSRFDFPGGANPRLALRGQERQFRRQCRLGDMAEACRALVTVGSAEGAALICVG